MKADRMNAFMNDTEFDFNLFAVSILRSDELLVEEDMQDSRRVADRRYGRRFDVQALEDMMDGLS